MKRLLIAAAIGFTSFAAQAADIAISNKDAYAKIQNDEKNVLFIDVQTVMAGSVLRFELQVDHQLVGQRLKRRLQLRG